MASKTEHSKILSATFCSPKKVCSLMFLIAILPRAMVSHPVSTTAIRSDDSVNSGIKISEILDNKTKHILPPGGQEPKGQDLGLEIFGLDDYFDTSDYEFENFTLEVRSNGSETDSTNTAIKTISGQAIHECDENHAPDADGNCLELVDTFNIDRELESLIKQARACIKCIVSYIFYDYTDENGDVEEYNEYEEILDIDQRTINYPR